MFYFHLLKCGENQIIFIFSCIFLLIISNMSYNKMTNVAAHAAGQQGRRENFGMRRAPTSQDYGMASQDYGNASQGCGSIVPPCGLRPPNDHGCHFPAPHPHRVYCQPAAFHRSCGDSNHHLLSVAYGASRPLDRCC